MSSKDSTPPSKPNDKPDKQDNKPNTAADVNRVKSEIKELNAKKDTTYYWNLTKIADESLGFVQNKLYPMLRREGVGDKTISVLSLQFAITIQEVIGTQMSLVRPSTESLTSLEGVEKAVDKIYKQYSEGQLSSKDALDALFELFKSVSGKLSS